MEGLLLEGESFQSLSIQGGDSDGRYWVVEEMVAICKEILFENKIDLSDAPEICLNGMGKTDDNRDPDDHEIEMRGIRAKIRGENNSKVKAQWDTLASFVIEDNTAIPSSFFNKAKPIGAKAKSMAKQDPFKEQTQKTNDVVKSKTKKAFAQIASCIKDPFKDQNCGECSRLSCQNNITSSEDTIKEMSEDSFWD